MKLQILGMTVMALVVGVFVVLLSVGNRFTDGQAHAAATAGGGIPVSVTVATSAGGTAILLANPLRKALMCMNVGGTNPAYITFGQTPTATNGFLLAPTAATANVVTSGSMVRFPIDGCWQSQGCVPLGAVNAIATGGTTTVVCWED